jgi:hypothetical protein
VAAKALIRPKRKFIDKTERLRRLEYVLKKARHSFVKVGIVKADDVYPGTNVSVGQVAAWMEFGTHTAKKENDDGGAELVPARSFLRVPVDKALGRIEKVRDKQLEAIIHGETGIGEGLDAIGAAVQLIIQNAITRGIRPKLAESTVKQKRRQGYPDTPLIRTRFMFDHIGFQTTLNH